MKYHPTWDLATIPEELILRRAAQINQAKRKTNGGGAPIRKRTKRAEQIREAVRRYRDRQKEAKP